MSFKNYCTIKGKYNENEIIEIVDNSNGGLMYEVKINSSNKAENMTESEYRQALRTQAEIELKKNNVQEMFEIEVSSSVQLDIGEKAVVKLNVGYKEIAKEIIARSITHTYTDNSYERKVTFGEPENLKADLINILGVK